MQPLCFLGCPWARARGPATCLCVELRPSQSRGAGGYSLRGPDPVAAPFACLNLPGRKMGDLYLGQVASLLLNPTWCLQPSAVEISFLLPKGRLPTLSPEQTAPSGEHHNQRARWWALGFPRAANVVAVVPDVCAMEVILVVLSFLPLACHLQMLMQENEFRPIV